MKLNYSDSIKHWLGYLKDRLSVQERHHLEQEMNRDPFLQDAMDGFARISPDELEADLLYLQQRLNARPKKKKLPVYFVRMAASVALLAALSSLLWYFTNQPANKKQLAQETAQKSISNEQTATPLISEPAQKAAIVPEKELENIKTGSTDKQPIKTKKPGTARNGPNLLDNEPETTPLALAESNAAEEIETLEPIQVQNIELISEDSLVIALDIVEQKPEPASTSAQPIRIRGVSNAKTIAGRVVDAETKEAIPGATIFSENQGTVSNIDGRFQLTVFSDSLVRFSFVGMEEQVVPMSELVGNDLTIELKPSALALDEVVVVGYGRERKKLFTRSTGTVKTDQPSEALNGKVAGVSATRTPIEFKRFDLVYETRNRKHAQPEGGIKKLETYFGGNLVMDGALAGLLTLEFVVTADGEILNFSVFPAPAAESSNQLFQLLLNGPKWNPANNEDGATDEKVKLLVWF